MENIINLLEIEIYYFTRLMISHFIISFFLVLTHLVLDLFEFWTLKENQNKNVLYIKIQNLTLHVYWHVLFNCCSYYQASLFDMKVPTLCSYQLSVNNFIKTIRQNQLIKYIASHTYQLCINVRFLWYFRYIFL